VPALSRFFGNPSPQRVSRFHPRQTITLYPYKGRVSAVATKSLGHAQAAGYVDEGLEGATVILLRVDLDSWDAKEELDLPAGIMLVPTSTKSGLVLQAPGHGERILARAHLVITDGEGNKKTVPARPSAFHHWFELK